MTGTWIHSFQRRALLLSMGVSLLSAKQMRARGCFVCLNSGALCYHLPVAAAAAAVRVASGSGSRNSNCKSCFCFQARLSTEVHHCPHQFPRSLFPWSPSTDVASAVAGHNAGGVSSRPVSPSSKGPLSQPFEATASRNDSGRNDFAAELTSARARSHTHTHTHTHIQPSLLRRHLPCQQL